MTVIDDVVYDSIRPTRIVCGAQSGIPIGFLGNIAYGCVVSVLFLNILCIA